MDCGPSKQPHHHMYNPSQKCILSSKVSTIEMNRIGGCNRMLPSHHIHKLLGGTCSETSR